MKSVIILVVIIFSSAIAQSDEELLVKKMMRVTGTISSFEKMEKNMADDILKYYPEASEEDIRLIKEQIAFVYNTDTLVNRYIKHYLKVFNQDKVNGVLEVFENPLFIKVTELESRDIDEDDLQKFMVNFDIDEQSDERIELIERIKSAAHLNDFTYYAVKASIQIAVTVSSVLSSQAENFQIEELVDVILRQTEPGLDNYITILMVMYYDELSDDELEEYVDYYESELGKWYSDTAMTSHLNTLSESAELFTSTFPIKTKSKKS